MKIFVAGQKNRFNELREKISNEQLEFFWNDDASEEDFDEYDVVFDLNFDDDAENAPLYFGLKNKLVVVSSVKVALAEQVYLQDQKPKCWLIGFNALPGFINRSRWDICFYQNHYQPQASDFLKKIGLEFDVVNDRVGLVSARSLFMIINEACYTVQEGTASMEDVDAAMKLGTNYPLGPFEWADKIGITDVFETLTALYDDTKDERYKICALLKQKYLKNQPFYLKK